jgi:hypothetical protein
MRNIGICGILEYERYCGHPEPFYTGNMEGTYSRKYGASQREMPRWVAK